jgi:hypothetical protein
VKVAGAARRFFLLSAEFPYLCAEDLVAVAAGFAEIFVGLNPFSSVFC